MLWQSLWTAFVKDKLSLDQYLSTVFVNAPAETDYTIVGQIIDSMLRSKQYLAQIAPYSAKLRWECNQKAWPDEP